MAITYNPYNWEIREKERTLKDIIRERRKLIGDLYELTYGVANPSDVVNPVLFHKILYRLCEVEEEYIRVGYDEGVLSWGQTMEMEKLGKPWR